MNKVFTVIGSRGSGKTPFVIGGDFEPGLAKLWLDKGMSTLIVDEIDHVRYRHVPCLSPDQYSKLDTTPGIYRTLAAQHHLPGLIQKIAAEKLVWNTLMVMEDAKKYIPQRFTQLEWTLIGNSKQQNVDLVYMYWCWGIVPPDLIRNTNYLVIFNTSDGPECRKDHIAGCFDKCLEAHNLVKAGKHPYLIVDTGI